jgi:hypothetical protein
MFDWHQVNRQRRKIIGDDQRLVSRVRRFLSSYLAASDVEKELYYEVVAGASSGCQPANSVSQLESERTAEMTAELASSIAKQRQKTAEDGEDGRARFITDAYATTAMAYRRAAGIYANDEKMLQLGTAAVHLLTIATSHMMARSKEGDDENEAREGSRHHENE